MTKLPRFYIMLGSLGSGKGTQAHLLKEHVVLPHLSTGDVYRRHIRNKTEIGRIAQRYLARAELVPDNLTNDLVHDLLRKKQYARGAVLDGFPRTIPQAQFLDTLNPAVLVIYLDISDDEVLRRMSGRRICANGHVYHTAFNPSKKENVCDVDGLPLTTRADDTERLVKQRLENYHLFTKPLLSFYKQSGRLITVNGKQSIKDVFGEIQKKLEGHPNAS